MGRKEGIFDRPGHPEWLGFSPLQIPCMPSGINFSSFLHTEQRKKFSLPDREN